MTIRSTCTPTSSSRFRMRSCVSGRGGTMPWRAKAMEDASDEPIQMGRYRSPSRSFSSTMGWFEGSSTRTPIRFSSIIARRPLYPHPRSAGNRDARSLRSWFGRGQRLFAEERDERVRVVGERLLVVHGEDERKVAVTLAVIQSVPHDEAIGTVEPDVPNV